MLPVRFKMVDLAVVAILGAVTLTVLAALLVPRTGGVRELAHRIKCASNLRQIGLAMRWYANDDPSGSFPRTIHQPDATPVAFTGVDCPNPFTGPNAPAPNDVTAAVFLLLRTQDITPEVFICPVTDAAPFEYERGKTVNDYSNFRSQGELSYSFHNPYGPANSGIVAIANLAPDFAIAADINPGVPELLTTPHTASSTSIRKLNSPNHDGDGQNVLYADGHAEWQASPFVGVVVGLAASNPTVADNIYTFGPNPAEVHPGVTTPIGILGTPAGANDSILLPAWDASVVMPLYEEQSARNQWFIIGIATAAIFLVGIGVYVWLDRRRRRT